MTTHKRATDGDAYRELPFLLKPSPLTTAQGRRCANPPAATDASPDAPPPPSAGFNPYFDLPPDSEAPVHAPRKGKRP